MSALSDLPLLLLNGVTWGITLSLVALGLNFIFGLLGNVNIAHGSLYMAGAVAGWFIIQWTGNFWLALLVAPLIIGAAGVLIERVVLRPIENDVSMTVIVTFGLMLIIDELGLLTFGPGTQSMPAPITASLEIAGFTYPVYRIFIAVFALVVMALLYLFLQKTRHGLWMRGARQDPEMAESLGIPTDRVYALTFGLGTFFAAFAGMLMAPIVSVNHLMGHDILAIAFIIVVVGGLGSLRGVLIASVLFGLIENLGSLFVSPVDARILAFVVMGLFILVRPEGLFSGGATT